MKLKGHIALLSLFFFWAMGTLHAQQEWLHTQHAFSLYDVNAAAVGNGQQHAISVRYRNQWTGVEGAPESFHFSYQKPFTAKNITYGVQVFSESIGAHNNSSLQLSGAYRLKITEASRLYFALEGGLLNHGFDRAKLVSRQINDPALDKINKSNWSPLINSALFWRNRRSYFGIELNRILEAKTGVTEGHTQSGHINAIAGHAFPLGKNSVLKPMAILRLNENQTQLEIQTAVFLRSQLWLGVGYREGFGFLSFVEYQFSSRLRLGYAFDLPSAMPSSPGATHELFLGLQWAGKNSKSASIRYFQ